ncbi:flagellin [Halomonas mongoliensis]|uniref:Flagellin n=1 Tax=Halomonas mongoliensis TaxID=321265 RepID=A0ABU1GND0_9GAMM|nr:flagellin [Halomonas mongoliensis]MDR5893335.1 flagellin [Halomonas mongoliensis]
MSVINTNLTALKGQSGLSRAQGQLSTAMERLSSGMRVNGAKDDAAGQAIGNRMTSQINGRGMAQRNASDGVSMSQTAQGALDQVNDKLQRIRELTVQGLNGTLSTRDSDVIQAEINMNLREIDRLASSVDYNGIPLLSGQAGEVSLQVGANDGETLSLDLRPPGFGVDALGLTEFNVAGIEGEVAPRNMLQGKAVDIHLYAQRTAIQFVDTGGVSLPGSQHALMEGGAYGSYVSAVSGGQPVFYDVTTSPVATHETATDSSSVTVTTQSRIYDSVTSIPSRSAQRVYLDENGSEIAPSGRVLVRHGDDYLVRESQGGVGGVVSYYPAELDFQAGGGALRVTRGSEALPSPGYAEIGESETFSFNSQDYALEDFNDGEVVFRAFNGDLLEDPVLVKSDSSDSLYLQATVSGQTAYYRLGSATETTYLDSDDPVQAVDAEGNLLFEDDEPVWVPSEKKRLTLQAASDTAYAGLDLDGQTSIVFSTPTISLDDVTPELRQGNGESFSGSSRLMQRGQDDQFMIEERVADGVYRYYEADVRVEVGSDGEPVAITVTAQGDSYIEFNAEHHRVLTVSGSSSVTIDPRNVTVNYTDANGDYFENVLREGRDGNYYFDLPGSRSSFGSYKIATLVDTEDNEILIKTVNGAGEVIIYHPLDLDQPVSTPYALSVSIKTDANGFENDEGVPDGVPHTYINLVEVDQEIRLKKPANPLAALDRAISFVDSKRSHLGAMENRLASVIEGHESANISLSAARSRILDTDYATETANMVRAQILQQAGNSMLAQANVMPENVLALLG